MFLTLSSRHKILSVIKLVYKSSQLKLWVIIHCHNLLKIWFIKAATTVRTNLNHQHNLHNHNNHFIGRNILNNLNLKWSNRMHWRVLSTLEEICSVVRHLLSRDRNSKIISRKYTDRRIKVTPIWISMKKILEKRRTKSHWIDCYRIKVITINRMISLKSISRITPQIKIT